MKEDKTVPQLRFPEFTDAWKQRKFEDWGTFYYGKSCPKWSIDENAKTPCVRYGELYTKFGNKIDKVFSYTNIEPENLRFSTGKEVLIPRVGEDPFDYNHCTWLSIKGIAIGEMISVFNTDQDPQFSATMFNATLKNEFAKRVEGGSVTNLYFEKLKNILIYYPSLEEQKKIASFFERIDQTITLQQRKLNSLQKLKKGLLQKMFPKKGENIPEIRFPEFSDAWKQRKLSESAKFSKGNGYSKSDVTTKGIPLVLYGRLYTNYETVISNIDTYSELKKDGSVVSKGGEILVPASGETAEDISRASVIKDSGVLIGGDLNIIYPSNDIIPSFLALTITNGNIHKEMTKLAQGKTVVHLHNSDLSKIRFYAPTYNEQIRITEIFSNIDSNITLQQRWLFYTHKQS